MDYVSGEHGETPLEDKTHIDQLRAALVTLHHEGYVYGDLRGPNILIATDGLKLIDFDWCEKEGTARYPAATCLDPDLEWHSGVRRGGLIKKAHDIHMFNHLAARSSSLDSKAEEHGPPATWVIRDRVVGVVLVACRRGREMKGVSGGRDGGLRDLQVFR